MSITRKIILTVLLLCTPGKALSHPSPVPTFLEIVGIIHLVGGTLLDLEQPWSGEPVLQPCTGRFNALKGADTASVYGVEYWWGRKIWRLRPFAGIFATSKGGGAVFAGINHDVAVGRRFAVLVNTAAAYYTPGDGKELGSFALLRSGVEISFFPTNDIRIALTFHHMSHGNVFGPRNPGTETVTLAVAFPLDHPDVGFRDR